mgnify:CR=1 FL=1
MNGYGVHGSWWLLYSYTHYCSLSCLLLAWCLLLSCCIHTCKLLLRPEARLTPACVLKKTAVVGCWSFFLSQSQASIESRPKNCLRCFCVLLGCCSGGRMMAAVGFDDIISQRSWIICSSILVVETIC